MVVGYIIDGLSWERRYKRRRLLRNIRRATPVALLVAALCAGIAHFGGCL